MRGDAPLVSVKAVFAAVRSPHARGCTVGPPVVHARLAPFPACAGMHRTGPGALRPDQPVPRMRGDAPRPGQSPAHVRDRSPHARGCTAFPVAALLATAPFPACAGMHRLALTPSAVLCTVPRMRGDAPDSPTPPSSGRPRSPHARGCTAHRFEILQNDIPFPACAGMHRRRCVLRRWLAPVPRMRGDAPAASGPPLSLKGRSPHARGCTVATRVIVGVGAPFPACAGMHRRCCRRSWRALTVPRMRGDAPAPACTRWSSRRRSPHARGCTDPGGRLGYQAPPFPACAGMHRQRKRVASDQRTVPRMRGDAP